MTRGIWTHGALKTFLTRGLLRGIFRPLLYTKGENIHADFLAVLNHEFLRPMRRRVGNHVIDEAMPLVFWLVLAPKAYFEAVFMEDENGQAWCSDVVRKSTLQNGKECAYLTQAFVLWNLQQLLQNSNGFRDTMGFSIQHVEDLVNLILGKQNKVIQYLDYFRDKFDVRKIEVDAPDCVDPRDWPIVYVFEVARLLIYDKQVLRDTLQEWDNDVIKNMEFVAFAIEFMIGLKDHAIELAKERP